MMICCWSFTMRDEKGQTTKRTVTTKGGGVLAAVNWLMRHQRLDHLELLKVELTERVQ